ncbi:MAG TPA: hypothetical protein VGM54_13420 [Chthoniobacter sp.]|jgi:hypothetical protein
MSSPVYELQSQTIRLELTRTEKNRLNKQAQREREKAAGKFTVSITLTQAEHAEFSRLQEGQAGPIASFPKRALLTGAKFLYNSGNTRGGKHRAKSSV